MMVVLRCFQKRNLVVWTWLDSYPIKESSMIGKPSKKRRLLPPQNQKPKKMMVVSNNFRKKSWAA